MKQYTKEDACDLIATYLDEMALIDDSGIWPSEFSLHFEFDWKFIWELDGPDVLDPRKTPALPFPFTSKELAAFMLDGVGETLVSVYGGWEEGPDEEVLGKLSDNARDARQAMREAYEAYRKAEKIVGKFDENLGRKALWLASVYQRKNNQANQKFGVFSMNASDSASSDVIRSFQREQAKTLTVRWLEFRDQAKKKHNQEFAAWRKKMACQILQAQTEDITNDESKTSSRRPKKSLPGQNPPGLSNWKMKVQTEATAMFLRAYEAGANPTVNSIKNDLVRWCINNRITTGETGIIPKASYLQQHVLSGKHWKRPDRP